MPIFTEYEFTLPNGYVDKDGTLQRNGVMRTATAGDEILSQRDPRVMQNPSYLSVVLLSHVIIRLGTLQKIDAILLEGLFAKDLAFLIDMYEQINSLTDPTIHTVCPQCGCRYEVPLKFTEDA